MEMEQIYKKAYARGCAKAREKGYEGESMTVFAEAYAEAYTREYVKARAEMVSSIVHNMKNHGMSIEDIAKMTGLALEEIENL